MQPETAPETAIDTKSDIIDWLALNVVQGIGPRTVKLLLDRFSTPTAVFAASRSELQKVGLRRDVIENLHAEDWHKKAKIELAVAEELGVTILTIADDTYPQLLKEIYDPPPLIYVKGDLTACTNQPCWR